ncbi:MAG TPA: hypothetical protein VKU77_03930 [Streptosporangiaceae bacterium]|nr:hypothetical protein [Streptosporangiaceae bacterium]
MSNNNRQENPGNTTVNTPEIGDNVHVISYNVAEGQRPGGIKVRFKIRVVTGKRAREIDARQARAIMEVLQWHRQHHTQTRAAGD